LLVTFSFPERSKQEKMEYLLFSSKQFKDAMSYVKTPEARKLLKLHLQVYSAAIGIVKNGDYAQVFGLEFGPNDLNELLCKGAIGLTGMLLQIADDDKTVIDSAIKKINEYERKFRPKYMS